MPAELQKLCGATTMEFIHSMGSAYYAQAPLKIHMWIDKLRVEATSDRLVSLMDVNSDGVLSESEVIRFSNVCLGHQCSSRAELPPELERCCDASVSQFRALIKRAAESTIQEYIANMGLCLKLEAK